MSPTSETTRANHSSGRWNYGREIAENFAESGDFHVILGSFTCRKFTTWDRRLYFLSEGRRAEDFYARKFRRLRPGLNPRTWVPECNGIALPFIFKDDIKWNLKGIIYESVVCVKLAEDKVFWLFNHLGFLLL
jgi:hypothetical protein